MEKRILVVDDEKPIVDILRINLKRDGYSVYEAFNGEDALIKAKTVSPDLILLDVMLPKTDGFTVCRKIREFSNVPIIMLTAREDEVDKILGLELGADDYMTKPFSIRELLARVKANIRRSSSDADKALMKNYVQTPDVLVVDRLKFNFERYEVLKDGAPIDLTLREFELISFLAKRANKIFSRKSLLENVWDYEYYGDVRTVDVTIRRIREKIEDDPSQPTYLITKRGIGYYFRKEKEGDKDPEKAED